MKIAVLGPVTAEYDGIPVDLGARKQRQLLAILAMHRGRALSVGAIAEAMWDEPPASHVVVLQGYVSGLRKALEPARGPRQSGQTIVTTSTGYLLDLPADALDADVFEAAVRRAGDTLRMRPGRPWHPAAALGADEARATGDALDAALALWRGEPYAELDGAIPAQAERARLEEMRVQAHELRAALGILAGSGSEAFGRLETLAAAHPHRESLAMLRAVALVRFGRQVDALDALRSWRGRLQDEQGLDPSEALRELEAAILQQRLEIPVLSEPAARDEPEAAEIRVGIVDDHPVFRMGLSGLLGSIPGLRVAVDADGPEQAREQLDERVDVLLMDLDLGTESGLDLIREFRRSHPRLAMLVMSMHDEDAWVAEAIAAGAQGYLVKSAQASEIERAIRTVAQGGFVLDRGVIGAVRDAVAEASSRHSADAR